MRVPDHASTGAELQEHRGNTCRGRRWAHREDIALVWEYVQICEGVGDMTRRSGELPTYFTCPRAFTERLYSSFLSHSPKAIRMKRDG